MKVEAIFPGFLTFENRRKMFDYFCKTFRITIFIISLFMKFCNCSWWMIGGNFVLEIIVHNHSNFYFQFKFSFNKLFCYLWVSITLSSLKFWDTKIAKISRVKITKIILLNYFEIVLILTYKFHHSLNYNVGILKLQFNNNFIIKFFNSKSWKLFY